MNKNFLRLIYDKEAPKINECSPSAHLRLRYPADEGWERWSLPIGNGYFGANVFGRADTERIQITEKTLQNPSTLVKDGVTYFVGGLNSFSETYIDFGHKNVLGYRRWLDLKTAAAGVEYTSDGVKYTREYFASYPHKALVIRLDADKEGSLSFTLRPTIPHKQSFGGYKGDGVSKTGTVTSWTDGGAGYVELSGSLNYYGIDFLGIYRVYAKGGRIKASTAEYTYTDNDGAKITDINGTVTVNGADSAYIIACIGTDYELSSGVFTSSEDSKPTKFTSIEVARERVIADFKKIDSEIEGKDFDGAYEYLKQSHINDYSELFGRVSLDLGTAESDTDTVTDTLMDNYKSKDRSNYLEALLFQYGRYLLIASSRKGALPANLQGAWNTYSMPPWACGYWHNINVQMNYWPAFSTNLAETFDSYADYNAAYMKQAKAYADEVIKKYCPEKYGNDGGNGWVIGTDGYQTSITSDRSAGNLGFTTQLFWEQYLYTKDKNALMRAYGLLTDAARYITKCVEEDENGDYVVSYCDSPEMHVDGVWYQTKGTAYAQAFAYMNNCNALSAAKELEIDLDDSELLEKEEYSVLRTALRQIEKYNPVKIGLSGQIKEFREEDYYCSLGDEYHHRHISQLMGLYPASIINSTTPAWLDAATVSLNERGDKTSGWGLAHRLNAHARTKNGDRAHKTLEAMIERSTAQNLWDLNPVFQIDGNFGYTAAVSEMLLQSHEGYIAPLPALPVCWSKGSYEGLVARGNFVVSAVWEDGLARQFKITSRAGGTARVYYPTAATAHVVSENGEKIEFTVQGKDLIAFETENGKTYCISGFGRVTAPRTPDGLKTLEDESVITLSWNASVHADGYNVYSALGDSPEYTLIGNTCGTDFTYKIPRSDEDERITFAVTAVGADGYESRRALCYRNPRVKTSYGTVPAENSNMPFALFERLESKYSYIGSRDSYSDALALLKNKADASKNAFSAVIYILKNTNIGISGKESIQSCGCESIMLDLGGRTLILNDTLLTVDESKSISVTVKNGKILTESGSVAKICSSDEADIRSSSTARLSFRSVVFGREIYSGKTVPLFISCKDAKSLPKTEITVSDCTVDYLSASETKKTVLFDFGKDNGSSDVKVLIRGGSVRLRSFNSLMLFNGKCDGRIVFGKDENGNGTLFRLTDLLEPDILFTTDKGAKSLKLINHDKVHHTLYANYTLSD